MTTATRCYPACYLAPTAANKAVRSFWILGVLNNAPWVLMLAVATNISAGGVALVFLSNQIPGLIVKSSAPYWFHLVSYEKRMLMVSVTMGLACFLVGCGGFFRDQVPNDGDDARDSEPVDANAEHFGLALELLGVSFISFSCSLGEASLLALAGKFDSIILPELSSNYILAEDGICCSGDNKSQQNDSSDNIFTEEYNDDEIVSEENESKLMKQGNMQQKKSITAFSSGTGLAGIVGYAYNALFSELFGLGLTPTVWSAMMFALMYWIIYVRGLHSIEQTMQHDLSSQSGNENEEMVHSPTASESSLLMKHANRGINSSPTVDEGCNNGENASSALEMVHTETIHTCSVPGPGKTSQIESIDATQNLTTLERFSLILSLWPYTIPLFTVYAAEYMLQAGVWSAIGFPVTSAISRARFYHYSNWTYQAGVFLSRSSGNLWTASIPILWFMPFLQVVNLYFFWVDSIHHFWYDYGLLLLCFAAGLLGGSVYVQGFSRVNADMPKELREFAVASVAAADSWGILVADILSLYIQSCIYEQNSLEGAVVDCPF